MASREQKLQEERTQKANIGILRARGTARLGTRMQPYIFRPSSIAFVAAQPIRNGMEHAIGHSDVCRHEGCQHCILILLYLPYLS